MHYSELWHWNGTIGRAAYAAAGLAAFALKHTLDRLVVEFLFGRNWSLLDYWISPFGSITPISGLREDRGLLAALLGLALPFIWLGVVLTLGRLRSVGWPPWLVALFFVPFLNLSFFLLLCAAPAASQNTRPPPRVRWIEAARPLQTRHPALAAVLLANLIAAPLAWLAMLALGQYGWGLFVGLPFFLGFCTVLFDRAPASRPLRRSLQVSTCSLLLACTSLLILGWEGLICIAMALPLAAPLVWLGAVVALRVQQRTPRVAVSVHVPAAFILALPAMLWLEHRQLDEPPIYSVNTAVEIEAPPSGVWDHVVSFDELPAPEDWVFRLGIAYPTRAEIDGTGPGAIRLCVFSTGAFVEPIEVWDEPRLLKFSVTSTPAPMTELTPYGDLQLPHLEGFFVAEGGQFLLEPLPGGRTRLIGTTWYRHGLWPAFYWRWWSDELIHRIHLRVLHHIERLAEAEGRPSAGLTERRDISGRERALS